MATSLQECTKKTCLRMAQTRCTCKPRKFNPYSFEVFNHFWWMMMDVNHLAPFRILDPPIHGSCQLQKQPVTLLPASSGLLCLFQTLQFQWNKKWSTIFTKITTNATPHQ